MNNNSASSIIFSGKNPWLLTLISILLFLLLLFYIGNPVRILTIATNSEKYTESTMAEVGYNAYSSSRRRRNSHNRYINVTYTVGEDTYTYKSIKRYDKFVYGHGDYIEFVYNPDDPSQGCLKDDIEFCKTRVILNPFIAFILAAVFYFIMRLAQEKKINLSFINSNNINNP